MHACRDGYEVFLTQAEVTDDAHTGEAALAAGVCHGAEMHGLGLVDDGFKSEGDVVVRMYGNGERHEWLWLRCSSNPSIVEVAV